ncbi:hypothetical protein A1O1_02706 [Capronia coronata CBS 617.96]|uniref:RRM domain-containing protein n=1 Tax=Capronia coronata CBS 617.96 TaxID=1182541 RepID=W9YN13_9EURO|nr:uncharacterized protein A1O1_02706 [Capronia coronata CBS 617.96]EXJ94312.1 hypothetical protein A1O1_02706 [Capronia coronata CBS 617.96]
MSGRLDQSLDSIIDSQKKAKRDVRRRKVGKGAGASAPVGGVKKSTRPAKSAIKPAVGSFALPKSSKIVVSGLPHDVNEAQIKTDLRGRDEEDVETGEIIPENHMATLAMLALPKAGIFNSRLARNSLSRRVVLSLR